MTVFILSREARIPFEREKWFENGKPLRKSWQWFSSIGRNNAILDQGATVYRRFADLAAINLVYTNPQDGLTVMVDGQGLATYKKSISTWVLSADDTTVVT